MSDFTLNVGGLRYSGWTALSVTRGLSQLTHSFNMRVTDQWAGLGERVEIRAGQVVVVKYGNQTITTGYIDDDELSYSAGQRSLSFSGRSKTGDLVDCAAVRSNGKRSWLKAGLSTIASEICDPFGISATINASAGGAFSRFTIEEGETAFMCLERAARRRGLLLLTDNEGNLIFDRAGSGRITTRIEFGKNVLRSSSRRSWRDRFQTYTISTQATGDDNMYGTATSLTRTVTDSGVDRYRPTVILADTEDSGAELKKRANWECNTRAGKSRELTYTVRGWEHDDGLWEPNQLVRVVDEQHWLDDELLITGVTQRRDESGTVTDLQLSAKEAFDVQPLPSPKAKSFWES
jgi:prophage tail gpP-like protein